MFDLTLTQYVLLTLFLAVVGSIIMSEVMYHKKNKRDKKKEKGKQ